MVAVDTLDKDKDDTMASSSAKTHNQDGGEASASPQDGESYSSKEFMSQVDGILSGEAESSVEALQSLLSSTADVSEGDDSARSGEDDVAIAVAAAAAAVNDSFDSAPDEDPKSETIEEADEEGQKERTPTKVKFSGMDPPSPPRIFNVKEASRSELVERLGGLQERLTQAQLDLKAEKSTRRKKEKNLVKLAKELSKRQLETSKREEDVANLNQLVAGMSEKLKKASELEETLRATIAVYEKKWAVMGEKFDKANEMEGTLRNTIEGYKREKTGMVDQLRGASEMKENQCKTITTDGFEKNEAGLGEELETPPIVIARGVPNVNTHAKSTAMEHAATERAGSKKTHGGFLGIILFLVVCLTAFVLGAIGLGVLSADGMCAPVMPGSLLSGDTEFAASAPWWAPNDSKVTAFDFFCDGRTRVHLTVMSGKLHLFEELNGKAKTLHRVSADSAQINGDAIIVENKKGKSTISPPWLR